ncbi:uncharacterized protein LOC116710726 [Xiphophorus hellerii]|uniref:uncharacterized protein LOC116710726 n=1 Tax=Xiphophorus hellerii TaxID=8084 RepID=UPI0013B38F49|nr:uncharacterized protein LOC116710726 [Xiphophorus hellerii]
MGKSISKNKPTASLKSNDWKYVEDRDPHKIKHLDKWITNYNFDGRLNSQKLTVLQDKIKQKTNSNQKKMRKEGYEDVKFWLELAQNREEGEKKSKNLLFYRREDDETGPRSVKRQAAEQQAAGGGGEVAEVNRYQNNKAEGEKQIVQNTKLYPDLPSPPQYEEKGSEGPITRSQKVNFKWSKNWGEALVQGATAPTEPYRPPPCCPSEEPNNQPHTTGLYPMIQVANPNAGEDGAAPTILVYRTWTLEDIKKALEGITPLKEDVNRFVEDMNNIRESYHLNGNEVQQAWMTALGSDWHHVRGDWTPLLAGNPPQVLAHNSNELTNRVNALAARTVQRYQRRANYTEISRVKQKEEESFDEYSLRMTKVFKTHSGLVENNDDNGPYKQQLKNALHAGSKDAIRAWVAKHYIGLGTGTLDEYINHAIHAEKVSKEKKKVSGAFFQDEEQIFYQDRRGRGSFRGRSQNPRGQRGRMGRANYRQNNYRQNNFKQNDLGCWCCGKEGHIARHCPEKYIDQSA